MQDRLIGDNFKINKHKITLKKGKYTCYKGTTLQSSIFPGFGSFFSIKRIRKHLTLTNLIVGVVGFIVMNLVKELGIAIYIISYCNFIENTEYAAWFVAGLIGLIIRLGLKGIVEEILIF